MFNIHPFDWAENFIYNIVIKKKEVTPHENHEQLSRTAHLHSEDQK